MGEPILYEFVALGADEVTAAFAGHAAAAERSAKAAEGSYARTARAAQGAARTQKTEAEKAAAEEEKAAAKRTKADEKAAAAKTKAEQRAATAEAKASAKATKDHEKQEQAKAKATDKWLDNRIKTHEKWAREEAKAEEKATRKAEQEAEKRAKAEEKAAKRKAAAEKSAARAHNSVVQGLAHDAARMTLGLGAAGAASFTALIGKAVTDSVSTQSLANRISVNGRAPGEAGVNPAIIRHELEATAIAHAGQTAEGIAGGVAAFQENRGGNAAKALDEARKYQDVIATVASATGKDAGEIGKAAAILAREGEANNVDEMGAALARLVAQARKTGEPIDEAVQHLDKLGAAAKRFGLTGPAGTAQLGALQSIAAEGAGAGQADKAVEQFFKRITTDKVARQLKGAGIDPYADKNGHLKSPREILEGMFAHVGRADSASDKVSTIGKLLGPKGALAIDPLGKAFEQGYAGAKGTDQEKVKAGVDAMLAAFDRAGAEVGSYADLQAGAKQAESDSSAQLTAAYEQIKAIVGAELAPELAKLASELARDPGAIAEFTEGVRAAAKAIGPLTKALEFFLKYSSIGEETDTNSKILDLLEGKLPGQGPQGPQGPAAPINPATGLPAYATNPAATGQMPGAFGGGPPLLNPANMPPAVGATPATASGAPGAPAVAPSATPGASWDPGASASAFKSTIEGAARTFAELVVGAVPKGDVFGGRGSAVDPS